MRKIMEKKLTEATSDGSAIRIFLSNYGDYNNGELTGEWLSLPMGEDELQDAYDKLVGDGEAMIQDYEADFKINETDDIFELNELAQMIEDDTDGVLSALIDYEGMDYGLEIFQRGNYSVLNSYTGATSDEDLGYAVVDDYIGGVENLDKDTLEMYFDYERYGSDMAINNTFIEIDGGWVEVY